MAKFLRVIIDDKLSFSRHISYIKNKISKGMGIIIKARKYLNKKSLLDLYHAFVYPYLTYCIEVWGNMSHVHLDALVKFFFKIVSIITYSPYLAHTDELFKDLNILPIHKLKIYSSIPLKKTAFCLKTSRFINKYDSPRSQLCQWPRLVHNCNQSFNMSQPSVYLDSHQMNTDELFKDLNILPIHKLKIYSSIPLKKKHFV